MHPFVRGDDVVRRFARYRERLADRPDVANRSDPSPGDRAVLRDPYPPPRRRQARSAGSSASQPRRARFSVRPRAPA